VDRSSVSECEQLDLLIGELHHLGRVQMDAEDWSLGDGAGMGSCCDRSGSWWGLGMSRSSERESAGCGRDLG
jgi:hypothetical protein